MLTRFDNGLVLYSHNQLYGRWYVTRLPRFPNTSRSLRVSLETSTHVAQLFSATDIDLMDESELVHHPFLRNVGPDCLDAAVTPAMVAERLLSPAFQGRMIANFYLDQRFIAGIGNYLRSEIFWCARVSPTAKPRDLGERELERLAKETLRVCKRSYAQRGVTVAATLARQLKQDGHRYRDYRHYVFGRENEPCRDCGTIIKRRPFASRKLFYCPRCQPEVS
jgi:endonuclease-8